MFALVSSGEGMFLAARSYSDLSLRAFISFVNLFSINLHLNHNFAFSSFSCKKKKLHTMGCVPQTINHKDFRINSQKKKTKQSRPKIVQSFENPHTPKNMASAQVRFFY
jgi:hypothetical protein